MFDPTVLHGWWSYNRGCDVGELTDEVIDVTVEHALRIKSPLTLFPIFQLGGAIRNAGDDETAFNGRQSGHTYNFTALTETAEGFEEERAWARTAWSALQPHQVGVYTNFLGEGQEQVREAYGAAKYDRLKALKRTYDPDNFFRLNQNIKPD